MCGIVGSYNFNGLYEDDGTLDRAISSLAHRGPDGEGKYISGPVGLGHRRLSIIDTSEAGKQPFSNENGRYTITFNGEIYNYKEIRKKLLDRGHQFRSGTDTEVLLKGYIEYGEAILEELNGFFAFGIYDREAESIFLARDRFGIKPLYWAEQNGHFLFASELKALIALGISKDLDRSSLAMYLQLTYIPAPWTIFQNCQKLLPGHKIKINKNGVEVLRYYDPRETKTKNLKSKDLEGTLRYLLDSSVERRLVSDVPLGSFLSGGVDSSIIALIAAEKVKGYKTFSIGFPDHSKYDESRYAEEVAKYIGSDHTSFSIREDDLKNELFNVIDHLDEPFADSSAIPVYVLSQRTRQHVTVALSGDGADEIFSGYTKHLAEYKISKGGLGVAGIRAFGPVWKALKGSRGSKKGDLFRKLDRFARSASLNPRDRYWFLASFTEQSKALDLLSNTSKKKINERLLASMAFEDPGKLNEILVNDIMNVLPNDMLKKVDSMSMAHGLEVRTPFLDHEVVEFTNSLPTSRKFGNGELKSILRSAYKGQLPDQVFDRPKQGFEVPLLQWFRTDLYSELEGLFSGDRISEQGIFDQQMVNDLLISLKNGKGGDVQATIYALLVFQRWWKMNVLDADPH